MTSLRRFNCPAALFVLLAVTILSGCAGSTRTSAINLFNGKDLSGWYTVIEKVGINSDPEGIFKVENGILHILGKQFGYLCTKKEYENYRLIVEFKWGEKKFPPARKRKTRQRRPLSFPQRQAG